MSTGSNEPFPQLPPEALQAWENISHLAFDRSDALIKSSLGKPVFRLINGAISTPNLETANQTAFQFHRKVYPEGSGVDDTNLDNIEDTILNTMLTAASTAYLIDAIKIRQHGHEEPAIVSNQIINAANGLLALDVVERLTKQGHEPDRIIGVAKGIMGQAQSLRFHTSNTVAWLAPKIHSFSTAIYSATLIVSHLQGAERLSVTEREIREREAENNDLFKNAKNLQKYGLKSAIAPSLGGGVTKEWLVFDADQLNTESGGIEHPRLTCAAFMGSSTRFKSSKPEVVQLTSDEHANIAIGGVETGTLVDDPSELSMSVSISMRGELVSSGGHVQLRPFFKRLGRLAEYEQLRSELLAIYFDLVTPVYVQDVIHQEAEALRISHPDYDGLRRLVIARTRVIKILKDEIEEVLNTNRDVPRGYANGLVRHPVINHIRALPPGYRASEEARRRCLKDFDYVLAEEGETYVRPHHRGTLENKSAGHKAAYKVGQMAAKQQNTP